MTGSSPTTRFGLRPARPDDVALLQRIEVDAAQRYGALAATRFCLDLPARQAAEHAAALGRGLALVAEAGGEPVGFLLAMPMDGCAHILEVAVAPGHQHQGCGRVLIAAAEDWARRLDLREMTLTTFRDVGWNAPWYARLGYDVLQPGPHRPELNALIAAEVAAGVHRAPRVAMVKRLP